MSCSAHFKNRWGGGGYIGTNFLLGVWTQLRPVLFCEQILFEMDGDDDTFDFTDDGSGMGMPLEHEPHDPRERAYMEMMMKQQFYITLVGAAVAVAAIRASPFLVQSVASLFQR